MEKYIKVQWNPNLVYFSFYFVIVVYGLLNHIIMCCFYLSCVVVDDSLINGK